MVGIPARQVQPRARAGDAAFRAYGTSDADVMDPTAKAIEGVLGELEKMRLRLEALEAGGAEEDVPVCPAPEDCADPPGDTPG